ncbi:MAG TPA: thioredoxin domain-containing protein [Solirubrobacteraceae bacterium]|jgi:protein-disulfide isomerase
MASRTKQKEQARAQRLAEEQARQERARRQQRMRMLGGVILAAVAVVVVLIAVSAGGGSSATGLQTGPKSTKLVSQVTSLLSGIPQSGATLGNPQAPVTMTYYGDLECPICKDFTLSGGFPQLVAKDIRAGKVKVVYKAFETATPSPQTFQTQQVAALAAGKQNHFWDYTELFYREQGAEGTGYVTESYLDGLAAQVPGMNVSTWRTARNDPALSSQISSDALAGKTAGVQGTPTLIFQGPKGQAAAPTGVPTYSDLQQAIKTVS